ncbi:MAG: hypothetical protein J6K25_12260 [Thermoguttaceae bacterium]|nr:hypothetical protein [Thermoguttaceae bacterium]
MARRLVAAGFLIGGGAAFVVCRFDRCVADAFFFRLAPKSPLKIATYLGIAFVGNACGARFLNATLKTNKSGVETTRNGDAATKNAA